MKNLNKIVWGGYFIAGTVTVVNSLINKDYEKAFFFTLLMSQSVVLLIVVNYYKE